MTATGRGRLRAPRPDGAGLGPVLASDDPLEGRGGDAPAAPVVRSRSEAFTAMPLPDVLLDTRRRRALLAANAAGVGAAAVFAGFGLARPTYVEPGSDGAPPAGFWAASSAVRTWAVAVPLLTGLARDDGPDPRLLTIAGWIQLGDSALGLHRRDLRMTLAPAAMGLVHLVSARLLAR